MVVHMSKEVEVGRKSKRGHVDLALSGIGIATLMHEEVSGRLSKCLLADAGGGGTGGD